MDKLAADPTKTRVQKYLEADRSFAFISGPIRDKGPRSYWRATVRRVRDVA